MPELDDHCLDLINEMSSILEKLAALTTLAPMLDEDDSPHVAHTYVVVLCIVSDYVRSAQCILDRYSPLPRKK